MAVVQTCEVLNLHRLTWVYNSLLPDRYVKDEHVLKTQFLWESKNYERECRLRVKKIYKYVLFDGDNLWTVAIRQMKFGAVKDNGHNVFILIITFPDNVFKHVGGAKFCGYVGTYVEQLHIKFYNFVQCHILENSLTFCLSV
jgi:hypothetical protein